MKKTKIELNSKLTLTKEKITGLHPEELRSVDGGAAITDPSGKTRFGLCASGSGCDCQQATCGIVVCSGADFCQSQNNICGPADNLGIQ